MQESIINLLSKHLFWDVDKSKLEPDKNKRLIVQRVLDYGLINDWKLLVKHYGYKEIAETAVAIKDLDIRSATFLSLISKIPLEKFICYTTKQSMNQHWNF